MTRHSWTQEHRAWLEYNVTGTSFELLTVLFNNTFGTMLTKSKIKNACSRWNLTNGVSLRKYTDVQLDYIKATFPGRSAAELTNLFNKKYNTYFTTAQLASIAYRNGIKNGLDCRIKPGERIGIATEFKKGQKSWNKGTKGLCGTHPNCQKTQFKKGASVYNQAPVGTEGVTTDGYVWVKTAEPNVRPYKHILIWEQLHGKIPPGHCLIFADGNKQNVVIENLILVTRAELGLLNRHHKITGNAELTKTNLNIVRLKMATSKKVKAKRERFNENNNNSSNVL